MAWFFGIPQMLRLFQSVKGVTITWLLFAAMFIVLNLMLTIGTYRRDKSRDTFQTLVIYANWLVLLIPMVGMTFIRCVWTTNDTIVSGLILGSTTVVVCVGRIKGRNLRDPLIRGLLVGVFRVMPHSYLAFCIVTAKSADGLAGMTVLAANITGTSRIITLCHAGRKIGWDTGRLASLWSETANVASWLVVTMIWFVFR